MDCNAEYIRVRNWMLALFALIAILWGMWVWAGLASGTIWGLPVAVFIIIAMAAAVVPYLMILNNVKTEYAFLCACIFTLISQPLPQNAPQLRCRLACASWELRIKLIAIYFWTLASVLLGCAVAVGFAALGQFFTLPVVFPIVLMAIFLALGGAAAVTWSFWNQFINSRNCLT